MDKEGLRGIKIFWFVALLSFLFFSGILLDLHLFVHAHFFYGTLLFFSLLFMASHFVYKGCKAHEES